jgi:NTE family protein
MTATRTSGAQKPVNLALQGGGSHGAMTWGVLDALLEDERLKIRGVSGTSAGAMNAAVLADGFARGGREGARDALRIFWNAVSDGARFSPISRSAWNRFTGDFSLDNSPGYLFFDNLSRVFSPYELNPTGANPLRDIVGSLVDFGNVNSCAELEVFVTATNVRTGRPRIFRKGEVTADSVLASACLPQMFPAVEIDGEAYWDGGFVGNPALYPLIQLDCPDIVVVQINPLVREGVPRTARDIINRVNEISFNSSLIKELQAINLAQRLVAGGDFGRYGKTYLHMIHGDDHAQQLSASSKMNAERAFLDFLFERGRGLGRDWLETHYDRIGVESTLDLDDIEDAPRPPIERDAEPT